jgi:thioredoxin reductase (NADPH)
MRWWARPIVSTVPERMADKAVTSKLSTGPHACRMQRDKTIDCLIIGAGPAGLSSAIYLARYCRSILIVDDGRSRAELIPSSHNYPGFRGISGSQLLKALRTQVGQYEVPIREQTVTSLRLDPGGGITARLDDREEILAAQVVLATGIVDASPELPGLRQVIYQGALRFCPICDAYEAMDKRIGILGPAETAHKKALFLRSYSDKIFLLPTDGIDALSEPTRKLVQDAGINITGQVVDVEHSGDSITAVLADGQRCTLDVLYPALGCTVRSQLAVDLGAHCTEEGTLKVDDRQRTSIPNLYAAGDVVSDLHQLSVATGHAAIAATAIHNALPPNYR